ncbi:MAG: hypothetical protein KKA05_01155 [Alphaproteobacteria bacterium]|nr:hypothetical protein [Alphaproteobacteria bacterium]MBU0859612.1 hypothetical protein [Alphaproteobacteria bacterium]
MTHQQTHIRNVYISKAQRTPYLAERVLVIETDLSLPQSRFEPRDPHIDDLLIELNDLKALNPALFSAVNTVEIRGADNHITAAEDAGFPFVSGERVSSSRAVDMSVA